MIIKRKKLLLYNIAVSLLILIAVSLYHGIVIRKYDVSTDKITSDASINIVHVADLHTAIYGDNQVNLLKKIEKLNPDVILMTGDFFDTPNYYTPSQVFMEQAVDIAPCYYVTGNHEYWTYDIENIESIMADTGVNIIDNESIVVDIDGIEIELFGVDDPDAIDYVTDYEYNTWEEMLEATYSDKKTDSFSILLSHRPEKVEDYKKYDYDLILSGHSHGGQVRIPFIINGLYAPNQGWFPKYAGGKYQYNDTIQIVNRGLSKNPMLPRIFNPPEIVFIQIIGESTS